jgi:hypothetical protein
MGATFVVALSMAFVVTLSMALVAKFGLKKKSQGRPTFAPTKARNAELVIQ